jgi:8-amino-7-oxononanoate synthase
MRGIEEELEEIRQQGLWRKLTPYRQMGGQTSDGMQQFASNDYLGLAQHPAITEAFQEGLRIHGHGAAASRLVCGTSPAHLKLEAAIAERKGTTRALTFSTGYAAALGSIPALIGKSDFIIVDKLSHACLIDAAKLSGATIRVFPHNHVEKLGKLLGSIRSQHGSEPRILIVTESVFSMDGDIAPLRQIVALKQSYDAWLLVDEAHGFGVFGEQGGGLAEELGLQQYIELQMGTLSKAAGLAGGFIAGSSALIDLLINRARSFIYSTAPPPALAHAALRSVELIASAEGRALRKQLQTNVCILRESPVSALLTPIIPVILGSNENAMQASSRLAEAGFVVPAIRYPTVPRNTARLRISVSAAHQESALHALRDQLKRLASC